jgi:capsule polysaccharide modification protein KpsS
MTYKIESNQYIPRKGETSPNGIRLAQTYYYVVDEKGNTISHKTSKPYRGTDMKHYAFYTRESAEAFVQSWHDIKIQQAREFLEQHGYFTENLWHVNDVQDRYDCSPEIAQKVLHDVLTNEHTMSTIHEAIRIVADSLDLTPIE